MGEVYRATNVSLGRAVAIKLLSPEFVNIEADVLRFLREARAAAAVRHTNVVDVFDVARDEDGTPFIVQELLSGEDLEHYLNGRGGRLSCTEALEIMIPVADAVAAAHARDVVHRDLKPANIFLAKERDKITPKVLDFGACLFPTIAERSAKEIRMLIGTPHYMAPEQIVSKADVDQRSDVWALGVIVYEMIVGETPFEADSAKAVMELVKTRDVPPLRERAKDAPAELEELIAQCTRRDRLARLPNAAAVHERMAAVRARMVTPREDEKRGSNPSPSSPNRSTSPRIDDLDDPSKPSATTPKAAAMPRNLMTLSSPGSEPPSAVEAFDGRGTVDKRAEPASLPPSFSDALRERAIPPPSAERPIARVNVVKVARPQTPIDGRPIVAKREPPKVVPPKAAPAPVFDPSGVRELDLGPPSEPEPLDRAPSIPAASSMPPVLDPRAAGRAPPKIPPAPSPPKDILAALEAVENADLDIPRPELSKPEAALPEIPKAEAPKREMPKPKAAKAEADKPKADAPAPENLSVSRSMQRSEGKPAPFANLVAAVALPAIVGALAVRFIPAVGGPIGRALRGDSTLSSGVLAVVALLGAAALCARSLLGERTRSVIIAAAGSILFGIVMIIVTFSASEAAELGMPSSTTGLPTFVAPIAPIALALAAIGHARTAWARSYMRRDAIRSALFASVLLLVALVLSPIGAVRTASSSPPPARAAGI
jgi:eukaryotic-like serine/threonine-protein kinase